MVLESCVYIHRKLCVTKSTCAKGYVHFMIFTSMNGQIYVKFLNSLTYFDLIIFIFIFLNADIVYLECLPVVLNTAYRKL